MVISFPGFKGLAGRGQRDLGSERPAMHFAQLAELRAYWEALREGDALPRRAAIDPRGIEGVLDCAFLIERIAPGIARFRLAGMKLVDMMGMEVRGMPLSAMFDPVARDRLAQGLDGVFTRPAALSLTLMAERGIGRPALDGRMLVLPLVDEDGFCDLALGCFATQGDVGRAPRRFAIAGMQVETILTDSLPRTKRAAKSPVPDDLQVAAFAEAAVPFQPRPKPQGKPVLRLVK